MLFAVIPFSPLESLNEHLDRLGETVYRAHGPQVYFVSYAGTTRQLTEVLGLSDGKSGTGIVLPVSNYSGFAPADLWEWLTLRQNGE